MHFEVHGLLAGSGGQRCNFQLQRCNSSGATVDGEENLGHQEYFYHMNSPETFCITQWEVLPKWEVLFLFTHSPLDVSF